MDGKQPTESWWIDLIFFGILALIALVVLGGQVLWQFA